MTSVRRLFLLVVALPVLLGALYFGFMAQDRYVSHAIVTVRRANQDAMATSGLALLIAGTGGTSHEDTLVLREYLHSLGLMRQLDDELKLREHFSEAGLDPFYRLWPQASQEWMLAYWRSRVDVQLDEISGLLSLHVEGFQPEFARTVNAALLKACEGFVNGVSQRMAQEQMGFAQNELDRATQKLQVARAALLSFQTAHQMLDPVAQAQASGVLTAELKAQLAKVEAELGAKRAYLNEDTAEIASLRSQAGALRAQIARESGGATRTGSGALNQLAVEFHELKARAGFAEEAYKAAFAAVENTRVEAARKVRSLVVVEAPTLAQRAEYPRRIYNLATLVVVCLMVFVIVRLVLATVREHRD